MDFISLVFENIIRELKELWKTDKLSAIVNAVGIVVMFFGFLYLWYLLLF